MRERRLTSDDLATRTASIEPQAAQGLLAGAVPLSDVSLTPEMRLRLSIEDRRGEPYTEDEWSEAKRNLVEFFVILGSWQSSEGDR